MPYERDKSETCLVFFLNCRPTVLKSLLFNTNKSGMMHNEYSHKFINHIIFLHKLWGKNANSLIKLKKASIVC